MRSLPTKVFANKDEDPDQEDPQSVREIRRNLTGPQGVDYAAPLVGQGVMAPAQTSLLPTQIYNPTPNATVARPTPTSSDSALADLYQQFRAGPQMTALPEPTKPTVKGVLKEMGLGAIPVYGPMRRRMQQEHDAWQQNQVLLGNQNAMQRWQQTADIVKPQFTRAMDLEADLQKKEQNYRFALSSGATPAEAMYLGLGHLPPAPKTPRTAEPVQIEMPGGQKVPAYFQQNEIGVPGYYSMVDNSQIPVTPDMKIYRQTEQTETDKEWTDTKRMYEALYKQKHQIPDEQPLSDAQSAQASLDFKQAGTPAPQESWNAPTVMYDEKGAPVVIQSSNRGQIRSPELPGGAVGKVGLTAGTRQLGETARAILPTFDKWIARLGDPKYTEMLGPIMSRWKDFMAGKVGSADPEFAYLRTQIALLQTGTMRAHVGARGGQGLLAKFESLFNADKMDAPTLQASLAGVRDFLTQYKDEVFPNEAGGQGKIGVSYKGQTYNFPDQKSADAFKAELGIK